MANILRTLFGKKKEKQSRENGQTLIIDRYSEEYQKDAITKDKLSQIPHDHVTMALLGITNGFDLFEAEVNNNSGKILDILRSNPHIVHERDRFKGKTLLHHAVLLGAVIIAKNLLDMGADINSKDDDGITPLIIACGGGKILTAKLLISKGADVNYKTPIISDSPKDGWTPLHLAARNGHIKIIDLLIANGANVNATKADGWTPLHVSASFCQIEIVKFLLAKGANVNAIANDGTTVLMACAYAAQHTYEKYAEIAKLLLGKGADVNARDRYGGTALMHADERGNKYLEKILLDWQEEKYTSSADRDFKTDICDKEERFSHLTLFELSSPQFKNLPTSKDDDGPFNEAYNLIAQGHIEDNYDKALQVIAQNLPRCDRKDRLCELLANIYLNRMNPISIGWYMQSCVLGSRSWVPYLMVSYAARTLSLDDIAWRCLNACDVLDTGMKRIDKLEIDIAYLAQNANRSELISALRNFVKVLDPYLPAENEIPHDQMERATFLLQNLTGDQEMPPLKQMLRLYSIAYRLTSS